MKIIVKALIIIVILLHSTSTSLIAQDKIKIGLLVPISGEFSQIGQSIN